MQSAKPGGVRRLVAIAASLICGGCILQPTDAPACGVPAHCHECLARPGCGWCATSGRCVAGSTFGPDQRADCVASGWRFSSCAEPPGALGCGTEDSCGGCLFALGDDTSGCTWCARRGECVPSDQGCAGDVPVTDYDACSEATCTFRDSCSDCLAADCDWCDVGDGYCVRSGTECDPHYRFGFAGSNRCPPPNDCSSYFGCTSCLADPGCGWCDAPGVDGYCVASDGFGDYAGWCTSSSFYTSGCPR